MNSATDIPLFQLSKVSRNYESGSVVALREVDLEIPEGQYLTMMGQSGSGKSTLLQLLGGLDSPSSGEIRFRGSPLPSGSQLDRYRAFQIGFVFQSFFLISNLTAEENVQIPMLESSLSVQERRQRARELLQRVQLDARLSHRPDQLSVGQRQRVAIARALANQPSVLLADEPTGNLDSKTGSEIMDLFDQLNQQGVAIVMVTHDARVASRGARTIHLLDGEVIRDEQNR